MDEGSFARHLSCPSGRGPVPDEAVVGSAGGAPCGDLVRIAVRVGRGIVEDATFDAEGCGAALAAASACIELIRGQSVLDAARVGPHDVAEHLGGLSPGKLHAAELATDALHRALTNLWAGEEAVLDVSPERVLVAMSGGVDSAVAAVLARDAGHEVVAVTLKLWADPATDATKACCSPAAVVSARTLARTMGFPHLTLDMEERFRGAVVEDFLAEHDRGRTPNPCVRCNGLVRFDAMLALADRIGAETLVTGHYARIERDESGALLARAVDDHKDQTYMLSALAPELLERVSFPLGGMRKSEVREVARSYGLPVADRKESQDLCFMAGTTRQQFLSRHSRQGDHTGAIVDRRGRVLGRHRGHRHYTVGQRRGLGVAAPVPLYVLEKDGRANRVIVGGHDELAVHEVTVAPATLYRDGSRIDRVRLRYRSEPVSCELADDTAAGVHDTLTVRLNEPVHGVAPGQTACLLEGDRFIFALATRLRLDGATRDPHEAVRPRRPRSALFAAEVHGHVVDPGSDPPCLAVGQQQLAGFGAAGECALELEANWFLSGWKPWALRSLTHSPRLAGDEGNTHTASHETGDTADVEAFAAPVRSGHRS